MIQPPNTDFLARVVGFDAGLAAGTVGVQILDASGNVVAPRVTLGVLEQPVGSGSYVAQLTSPQDPGDYTILWDMGNVFTPTHVAFDPLTVTGGYVTSEVLPGEILASLDDINAELPADSETPVVVASTVNTNLLQINVARMVRGYLSRVIDNSILLTWTTPPVTPETIRLIAAKLIASQLYFNKTAESSTVIEDNSFAQKRYNEAIALLDGIIGGTVVIPDVITVATEGLTLEDGWPIDDTDRAFTMGQIF